MTGPARSWSSVVVLAGGVGGARLVDGLDRALPPGALSVIVNTGDDFRHWGLRVSPDLDTIMYTLAGMAPRDRGWGIEGDTFQVLEEVSRRGGDDWFQLGDRDLATHLARTRALALGASLTDTTRALCAELCVSRPILPMSDSPRPTLIVTPGGRELEFQHWLVKERAEPGVTKIRFAGPDHPSDAAREALERAELVVIGPSNPYVSIDPILELQGIRELVLSKPTIAVSPIIAGEAVRGPLARMIQDLGNERPSAEAVANHYGPLLQAFVVHTGDRFPSGYPLLETNILIRSARDRLTLAQEILELASGPP